MTTRYTLTSPRKRNDKTFWINVGSAFPTKNGDGFQLVFDALPLPDADGRVMVLMSPPREERQQSQQSGYGAGGRGNADLGEDIPFAPQVL